MKEKTEKSVNAQLAELQMPSEGSRGGSTRSNTCSSLANSDILSHTSEHADRSPTGFAKEGLLPHSMEQHPLKPKLRLMTCYVSGSAYKQKAFRMKLRRLFLSHGERELRSNMQHILKSGNTFVVRDRLIELRCL
ncbi:uncharacterized protein LOC125568116 [Nematostella vectensis]|uniref:uncharacterized protein LOC125568116 n=1 Tax=Nematostella vectensis TaxID=45351 RepID=UPI0020779572|nr:uncharacterized protein LOC125568116 [Nematostella vectensis]